MADKLKVYEGKKFMVVLQSMLGSDPYGWCLKSMPEGIIVLGCDNFPIAGYHHPGPVNQTFYLALTQAPVGTEAELVFARISLIDVKEEKETVKIELEVIANEEAEEVKVVYSNNTAAYVGKLDWPPVNEQQVTWPPVSDGRTTWPPV